MHPLASGPFAKLLDVHMVEDSDDAVVLALDVRGDHERAGGIVHGGARSRSEGDAVNAVHGGARSRSEGDAVNAVHGGVLMSMLDMAMAGSVARTLAPGESTVSVTLNTDFLRPAVGGRLLARARLERRGKTMAFPVGEVLDAEGKLVARATGVWAIRVG